MSTPDLARASDDVTAAAREHLDRLFAAGWSISAVALAVGLTWGPIKNLSVGGRFNRRTATRVLALVPGDLPARASATRMTSAPAGPVRTRLIRMLDAGWSVPRVAREAGVAKSTVERILNVEAANTTESVSCKILALPERPESSDPLAPEERVDAEPTRERLVRLRAKGLTMTQVAEVSGVSIHMQSNILSGQATVLAEDEKAIFGIDENDTSIPMSSFDMADKVREHLVALRNRSVSANAVARMSGVNYETVVNLVLRRSRTCRQSVADRLLALPLPPATVADHDHRSERAREHLRQLFDAGYRVSQISRAAGVSDSVCRKVLREFTPSITATTASKLLAVSTEMMEAPARGLPRGGIASGSHFRPYDPDVENQARRRLAELHDSGVTWTHLASALGVSPSLVAEMNGQVLPILKDTGERILALPVSLLSSDIEMQRDVKRVVEHVQDLRSTGQVNQRRIAVMAGVSPATLSAIMSVKRTAIRPDVAARLLATTTTSGPASNPWPKPCKHPSAPHDHGTYEAYRYDLCRCEPCSEAASARMLAVRSRQTA